MTGIDSRRSLTITTIYLIRHAHADWCADDDRPLSSDGARAALMLSDRLASRPIAAVYTSPSRRSVETVAPLAHRLGLRLEVSSDLRERKLPVVPSDQFDALVRRAWSSPDSAPLGGESNAQARNRGLALMRDAVARHTAAQAVLATHGNLLAIVMNALSPAFGYEFWRQLSFPDAYQLEFDKTELRSVERLWDDGWRHLPQRCR